MTPTTFNATQTSQRGRDTAVRALNANPFWPNFTDTRSSPPPDSQPFSVSLTTGPLLLPSTFQSSATLI